MGVTLDMAKIAEHPEHIAMYKLCLAGVGFHRARAKYEFISHYGDYIGEAPAYRVESFVAFMKRRFGVLIDKYPMDNDDITRPTTFGWQNLVPFETIEVWMEELREAPILLS